MTDRDLADIVAELDELYQEWRRFDGACQDPLGNVCGEIDARGKLSDELVDHWPRLREAVRCHMRRGRRSRPPMSERPPTEEELRERMDR